MFVITNQRTREPFPVSIELTYYNKLVRIRRMYAFFATKQLLKYKGRKSVFSIAFTNLK